MNGDYPEIQRARRKYVFYKNIIEAGITSIEKTVRDLLLSSLN